MQVFRSRTIESIDQYKNVQSFLKSKARGSTKTSEIYGVAVGYLETFLKQYDNGKYNVETIIASLIDKEIDVYKLIDSFVGFLETRNGNSRNGNSKLSARSIELYVAGIRSYLEYCDVDISSRKLKARVTLPKKSRIKKQALDSNDIRKLLLACNDQRLKCLITILGSSGARVMEVLTLRNRDIDLSKMPVKIFIKAEYTKTNEDRDILISKEAVEQLKMFLAKKYPNDDFKRYPNDLLFGSFKSTSEHVNPHKVYEVIYRNFTALLKKVGMDSIRSGNRRHINIHSLRSFTKTVIANQTNSDFSEYVLGHRHSTYYTHTDQEINELYLKKCEKYLTFLDYGTVQSVGRDYESKLREKDQELQTLKEEIRELEKSQIQSREEIGVKIQKLEAMYNNPKTGKTRKILAGIALQGSQRKKKVT